MARLPVRKTYKLFVGGAFPRSESGRTYEAEGQNVARASRKDVRDAVRAARGALPKWSSMTAYNRGQVLYRLAEMMEARHAELADLCSGAEEVDRSIDRAVWYAGWADKLAQVLGSSNPVAGPYFNFTVPEPTGVVAVLAPEEPPLLGLVTRLLPPLVGGNAVVAVASESRPLAAIELAEALATSDVPGGAVNILTGLKRELAPVLAAHMDVNALDLLGAGAEIGELRVPRLHHLREPVEHLAAVVGRHRRPFRQRAACRAHGVANVLARGPSDVLPLGLVRAAGLRARKGPADEELVRLADGQPGHGWRIRGPPGVLEYGHALRQASRQSRGRGGHVPAKGRKRRHRPRGVLVLRQRGRVPAAGEGRFRRGRRHHRAPRSRRAHARGLPLELRRAREGIAGALGGPAR